MTPADNLARVRKWLLWYAEKPLSDAEILRACDHCGSLRGDDVQRRLETLVSAVVRGKGAADAEMLEIAALVAADIEPRVKERIFRVLEAGSATLRAHAADIPEVPHA